VEAVPHERAGIEPPVKSEKTRVSASNPTTMVIPQSKALLHPEAEQRAIPRVIVIQQNQASQNVATLPTYQPIRFSKAGALPIRIAQLGGMKHQILQAHQTPDLHRQPPSRALSI